MDFSSWYSLQPNINSYDSSKFEPKVKLNSNWSKMYPKHLHALSQTSLNMYYAQQQQQLQSMNNVKKMAETKKENQSVFRSLMNIMGEYIMKGPNLLISHLSKMNNTLSVTVVDNDGIITPEFFENLTRGKNDLVSSDVSLKSWSNDCVNNENSFKDNKKYLNSNFDNLFEKMKKTNMQSKDLEIEKYGNQVNNSLPNNESLDNLNSSCDVTTEKKSADVSGMVSCVKNTLNLPDCMETSSKNTISLKYKLPKKQNTLKRRCRGRKKSQLRKSGVSQKKHRKKSNRRIIYEDIKDDLEDDFDWCIEGEINFTSVHTEYNKYNKNKLHFKSNDNEPKTVKWIKNKNCKNNNNKNNLNSDVKMFDKKVETLKFKSRTLSESSIDSEDSFCIIFEDNTGFSDSDDFTSIDDYDDDDDDDLESNDDEIRYSVDFSDDDSIMEDTEIIEKDLNLVNLEIVPEHIASKVRFNLVATIHLIDVECEDEAYEARRGPWETMVRDREHFKRRINHVSGVLERVLTEQHRLRIWEERFENYCEIQ